MLTEEGFSLTARDFKEIADFRSGWLLLTKRKGRVILVLTLVWTCLGRCSITCSIRGKGLGK